jgi:hypothetical protein
LRMRRSRGHQGAQSQDANAMQREGAPEVTTARAISSRESSTLQRACTARAAQSTRDAAASSSLLPACVHHNTRTAKLTNATP